VLDVLLKPGDAEWQRRTFTVIFGHKSSAGRWFDVALLIAVLGSVAAVMAESVDWIRKDFGPVLIGIEWLFTILFTIEYIIRLSCLKHKRAYALSFFGIVDLLAILPTYLSFFLPGSQALVSIRALRLLRVFRILKLVPLVREATVLRDALWQSRAKLAVFLLAVLIAVTIMGSLMHVIEGRRNGGFQNIPQSIYWAVITMTTVGYGDVVPMTSLGKFLSAVLIIFGYSLIVVPTGIVSSEMRGSLTPGPMCGSCNRRRSDRQAVFCPWCGVRVSDDEL
jgi:voltage-gated potassium channel